MSRGLSPYLVVLALLGLTALGLVFGVDVTVSDEAGIRTELPEHVGRWIGHELVFCQNERCMREFAADALADPSRCPVCEGELGPLALGERQLLPADTVIARRRYIGPDGQSIVATIVLSGRERASIHRPEICVTGQGFRTAGAGVEAVPLPGRPPLKLMGLDLARALGRPGRPGPEQLSHFAYWFAGKGRETPRHVQRLWWQMTDRVFHSVSHRWAYISVHTPRQERSDVHLRRIREFIRELYPLIQPAAGRAAGARTSEALSTPRAGTGSPAPSGG